MTTTGVLPETPSSPLARTGDPADNFPLNSPSRRWASRAIVVAALAAVVACGVAAIAFTMVAPKEEGPTMLHTVTRGDLIVTVTEQGTLESSNNKEVICKVRGFSTVTWVIPGGTVVKPGDELVRLDTKVVEENVSLTRTNVHTATATLERSCADVAAAEIGIDAYLKGRYRSQMEALQNRLRIAQRNLHTAKQVLDNSKTLFENGFVTELEVKGNSFTVTQAELELKVEQTSIDVLDRFTKKMQMERLQGNLTASRSKFEADQAGLKMELARRKRAEDELASCVIKADRGGLVIYPSAAAWKDTPDIAQGARVRKDQVLLLMPDIKKMQVKVGIHESMIDRVRPGLRVRVTLPESSLEAKVSRVASVTRPAGWWTGNVVKYDTVIELPSEHGLKPGMSAEVEVILSEHKDVLTAPVASVVETDDGDFCWVMTDDGVKRRQLQLGDTNEVFIVVKGGLKEGDQVVINPVSYIEAAKDLAAGTVDKAAEPLGGEPLEGEQGEAPAAALPTP